ncbi:MAG: hypothetical protein M5R36_07580 [Deltaproteobacteria bacterium]|nr:hypothetical protein [Deltaproteobacteria bacterium]
MRPDTFECRAAAGDCDVAEFCDGANTSCPADAVADPDTACDDGLFCNGTDTCADGACDAHAGDPCAPDVCDENGDACVCHDDECRIDDVCYADGATNPDNVCLTCDADGNQGAWSDNNGAACDDADLCTENDVCDGGACAGSPKDCPDGQSCDPFTGECVDEGVDDDSADDDTGDDDSTDDDTDGDDDSEALPEFSDSSGDDDGGGCGC